MVYFDCVYGLRRNFEVEILIQQNWMNLVFPSKTAQAKKMREKVE